MLGTRSTLLALHPSGILSFSSLTGDLQIVWLSPPGSQLLVVSSSLNTLFEFFQKDFIYFTSISWCIRAVCLLSGLNLLCHSQAFCCCVRGKSVTCGPVSTARDSVGCDQNFRWAKTTILTSAAVFWGLQLCSQQGEGVGRGWTSACQQFPGSCCCLRLPSIRDTLAKEE